ncbi:MAG: hypothetical protein K2Q24_12450 [Chitinophagaceae bacterium]|jgi:hypothetical protein|nr:hypothetical protein [Chitinophagaceae bacterium]
MFKPTWRKYLPVITILLKRSAGSEQLLNMNHTDFERASGGRKTKYSFSQLQLNSGRINSEVKHNPIAKELAELLQEDLVTNRILVRQRFEFEMNNEFQLIIRNNTPAPELAAEVTASEPELVESTNEVSATE